MSNTRIGKLLKSKFEALNLSTRTSGRYSVYMQALGKKLGLGAQVGKNMLLTKDTYPRVTASIFEKGILLNYWKDKSHGQLAGFIGASNSVSRRPSLKSFTISKPDLGSIDDFKFNGQNFINLTEYQSSKELMDVLSGQDLPKTVTPSEIIEVVEDANIELKKGKMEDDSLGFLDDLPDNELGDSYKIDLNSSKMPARSKNDKLRKQSTREFEDKTFFQPSDILEPSSSNKRLSNYIIGLINEKIITKDNYDENLVIRKILNKYSIKNDIRSVDTKTLAMVYSGLAPYVFKYIGEDNGKSLADKAVKLSKITVKDNIVYFNGKPLNITVLPKNSSSKVTPTDLVINNYRVRTGDYNAPKKITKDDLEVWDSLSFDVRYDHRIHDYAPTVVVNLAELLRSDWVESKQLSDLTSEFMLELISKEKELRGVNKAKADKAQADSDSKILLAKTLLEHPTSESDPVKFYRILEDGEVKGAVSKTLERFKDLKSKDVFQLGIDTSNGVFCWKSFEMDGWRKDSRGQVVNPKGERTPIYIAETNASAGWDPVIGCRLIDDSSGKYDNADWNDIYFKAKAFNWKSAYKKIIAYTNYEKKW